MLVVDDEKLIRLLLSRALKKEGIPVVDAGCGNEAIEKIRKRQFDLIILDLRLGDISGIDIINNIKKISPDTKIIVITAYGSEEKEIEKEMLHQSIIGFYEKPFNTFEVIEKIKKCLSIN